MSNLPYILYINSILWKRQKQPLKVVPKNICSYRVQMFLKYPHLLILIEPLFHDFHKLCFLWLSLVVHFFHLDRSCTILGAIFHKRKPSVTDSFHDLHGLSLPWQPDTLIWVQQFMQFSLLSTCPYHLRRFILNLDSNGWRLNREHKSCRLTSSSALTLHNQRNMAHSFLNRRWISSLLRAQHSLAWSKAPLTQPLNSIPCLANDSVEEEKRERSSRNFPPGSCNSS